MKYLLNIQVSTVYVLFNNEVHLYNVYIVQPSGSTWNPIPQQMKMKWNQLPKVSEINGLTLVTHQHMTGKPLISGHYCTTII